MAEEKEIFIIGSDHAGFEIKEYLRQKLKEEGYEVIDYGTFNNKSVDYTDIIHPLARDINEGKYERGIIICGSGNGAGMTANKYPNVRAALSWIPEIAELGKRHNNANIISLPGRFVDKETAWKIIMAFIKEEFEGGRHAKRVNKI